MSKKDTCGGCSQFQVEPNAEKEEWGGLCPQFGVGRNEDTEACTNPRARAGLIKSV